MRTLKQLLWLVYNELQKGEIEFNYGLCDFISKMTIYGKINPVENEILANYIRHNKPFTWYTLISFNYNIYWWPMGWKWPRTVWVYFKVITMK